ncbi:hypothetical protein Z948_2135 [Sulfitobacter donghicola DSW-25 = KCTC 12864 = JCM 14565]|nr:hypothetical protein Z948_2135 [Sulfitobacter donghicola DSW-25 = KCTC 12864 = JCM 14565]
MIRQKTGRPFSDYFAQGRQVVLGSFGADGCRPKLSRCPTEYGCMQFFALFRRPLGAG